jgi:hypothetical protein
LLNSRWIAAGDVDKLGRGCQALTAGESRHRSLAEIYQALQ